MSVYQMSPRTYEPRLREQGYGAYGGFADGSGPKVEAEILGLKAMLVSDLDTITKLRLPLVPAAQAVMAKVAKALMIINREKNLDQWGSKAHDTVVALKNEIVRDQSVLATKIATAKPMPVKAASAPTTTGGGLNTTTMLMGGGILLLLGVVGYQAMKG
jgi:hypothetical protein